MKSCRPPPCLLGRMAPAQSRLPDVRGAGARVGQAQPGSARRAGPDRAPAVPCAACRDCALRECWAPAITGSFRCILETLWMAHSSRSGRPSCGLDPTMGRGLGTVLRARVRHGQEQRSVRLLQGRVVAGYPERSGETGRTQARDLRATLSPLPRSACGAGVELSWKIRDQPDTNKAS